MIDSICSFLTEKIQKEQPEIDAERAEVINYGLHIIVGEIPKMFIIFLIAYLMGILKETLMTILIMLPFRACSGGFHLKTHIGCIVSTSLSYCGIAKISSYNIFYSPQVKIIAALLVLICGTIMVKLYAPADTENVPILRKRERKQKKILSYVFLTLGILVAVFIHNNEISNIIILGYFVQSLMISRLAFKLTGNKYGHEVYAQD